MVKELTLMQKNNYRSTRMGKEEGKLMSSTGHQGQLPKELEANRGQGRHHREKLRPSARSVLMGSLPENSLPKGGMRRVGIERGGAGVWGNAIKRGEAWSLYPVNGSGPKSVGPTVILAPHFHGPKSRSGPRSTCS